MTCDNATPDMLRRKSGHSHVTQALSQESIKLAVDWEVEQAGQKESEGSGSSATSWSESCCTISLHRRSVIVTALKRCSKTHASQT